MHAFLTVGVGGGEHGALGDVAAEHERGRAGALPVGAVAALRLPRVHRPQPHRHQDALLASHCSGPRVLCLLLIQHEKKQAANPSPDRSHASRTHNQNSVVFVRIGFKMQQQKRLVGFGPAAGLAARRLRWVLGRKGCATARSQRARSLVRRVAILENDARSHGRRKCPVRRNSQVKPNEQRM